MIDNVCCEVPVVVHAHTHTLLIIIELSHCYYCNNANLIVRRKFPESIGVL